MWPLNQHLKAPTSNFRTPGHSGKAPSKSQLKVGSEPLMFKAAQEITKPSSFMESSELKVTLGRDAVIRVVLNVDNNRRTPQAQPLIR